MKRTVTAMLLGMGLLLLGQPLKSPPYAPFQTVTVVVEAMPNSFAIPEKAYAGVCIVTRGIAQSPGVDYTITGRAVVFNPPPNPGDVVQLNCW
jgi:hypothetical protein